LLLLLVVGPEQKSGRRRPSQWRGPWFVNSEVSDGPAPEPYLDPLVADAAYQRDSVAPANGLVEEWFDVQDEHRES
jgi:hypothetical protein